MASLFHELQFGKAHLTCRCTVLQNHIEYSVINYSEAGYEKEYIHTHTHTHTQLSESCHCTEETTQHGKPTTAQ